MLIISKKSKLTFKMKASLFADSVCKNSVKKLLIPTILFALFFSLKVNATDGMLDSSFDPLSSDVFGGDVFSMAEQDNGQIIVGGEFTHIGGLPRNNLARLNADGTADPSFNPNPNNYVAKVLLTSDGKIIVGGGFSEISGESHYRLSRLNVDGSIDPTFSAQIDDLNGSIEFVQAMALQGSSGLLVGGAFGSAGGEFHSNIARLNSNGTVDQNFIVGTAGWVTDIAIQSNGEILVATGGNGSEELVRFESNGTEGDPDFTPNPNGTISSIAIQNDGKIVVVGSFSVIDVQIISRIARLDPDGNLDTSFNLEPNGTPKKVVSQNDGTLLISGTFDMLGTTTANRIARINPDGSIDSSFQSPVINSRVTEIAVQSDGNILIGGSFNLVDGISRHRIARLLVDQDEIEPQDDTNFIVIPLANGKAVVVPN